jgi:hypothetical protein
MKAEMEFNLMSCTDLQPWQLNSLYDAQRDIQRAEYQALYDVGGIAELNENTPTDFYDGDGSVDREKALCMAVEAYIKSLLEDWLNQARTAQTALFVTGLVAGRIPYVGIVAVIALKALAFITQTAINAVEDEIAVNDVICCMNDGLLSVAVSQAGFEASLDSCGFDVGSNQQIVSDIVSADLDNFKNWLSFLNVLGDSYQYINEYGVNYTCPCNDYSCYFYDEFVPLPSGFILPEGVATVSSIVSDPVGYSVGLYPQYKIPIGETMHMKQVNVYGRFSEDLDADHPNTFTCFFLLNDVVVHSEDIAIPTASASPSKLEYLYEGDVDEIRVFAFGWINGNGSGQATLVTIDVIVFDSGYQPDATECVS